MPLRHFFKTEIHYWLPMVLITYVGINGYLSGWTSWLVPDFHVPLMYTGDQLFYGVMFKRQIEGFWYLENMQFGYPFVSALYDFPMSFLDAITIKLFGLIAPAWYAVYTMYVVTSFVVNAIIGYVVMRAMQITPWWALVGATLFNLLPFHFYRIGHIVFTIYVCIPLVYYIAWQIWQGHNHLWRTPNSISSMIIGFVLGGYNIYYAVFSLLIIGVTTVTVAWRDKSRQALWDGGRFVAMIIAGIMIGLIPSFMYMLTNPNSIPLIRPIEHSVLYALWPVALFTFVPTPFVNSDAYMQIIGSKWYEFHAGSIFSSLGIIVVLWYILRAWLGHTVTSMFRFWGFQLSTLLLYCAVGSGGLFTSFFLVSIIRATNRFAIFAMFIGVFTIVWMLQQIVVQWQLRPRTVLVVSNVLLLICIIFDTPIGANRGKYAQYDERATNWHNEQQFFLDVERIAGTGAAIYQLPALAFPENDPSYRQTRCALYTSLACSHGNAFGRDGMLFYYMLASAPIQTQLDVLSRLGFTGMIIDRTYRAMPELEASFHQTLGYGATLESTDATLAYYRLPTPTSAAIRGRSVADIIETAQFLQADYALRLVNDIRTPIDLRKPWFPGSIKTITGMYGIESRGRWSNASDFRNVVITTKSPLPRQFVLTITARAWGLNINAPITVQVGNQHQTITFGATMSRQTRTFMTQGQETQITIIPPFRQRSAVNDSRYIALQFEQIQISTP